MQGSRYWTQDDGITGYWRWHAMRTDGCPYEDQAANDPAAFFRPEPGTAYVSPSNVVVPNLCPACHFPKAEFRPLKDFGIHGMSFDEQEEWV